MNDEINNTTTDPTGAGAAERVGFCQDCGTPVTRETVRMVGTGVFCDPCLAARVGATGPGNGSGYAAGTAAGYTAVPNAGPAGAPVGTVPVEGIPHPLLAGLLSIIPGVGTMYNGQYAKGVAHLLIFVVLNSLADHDHLGILRLLAVVWYFYQILEAYQTAKARLEGRPLPNPFGLNEIGERLGLGKNWGNSTTTAGYTSSTAGAPPASAAAADPAAAGYAPVNYPPMSGVPVNSGPDWVGYVPPTNFASAPPFVPPVAPPVTASQGSPAWGHAPYAATFTGSETPYTAQVPVVPLVPAARRFPTGAIWLIGLGALFLLIEFTEQWGWNINGNWVPTILFAVLAGWSLTRKLQSGMPIVCILRWPLVLGTLAVLFALQALDFVSLGRSWPVLFIVFGVTLILERTALANVHYGVPPTYEAPPTEQARAAWANTPDHEAAHDPANSGNNDLTQSGGL